MVILNSETVPYWDTTTKTIDEAVKTIRYVVRKASKHVIIHCHDMGKFRFVYGFTKTYLEDFSKSGGHIDVFTSESRKKNLFMAEALKRIMEGNNPETTVTIHIEEPNNDLIVINDARLSFKGNVDTGARELTIH